LPFSALQSFECGDAEAYRSKNQLESDLISIIISLAYSSPTNRVSEPEPFFDSLLDIGWRCS
jgi:hypothetical protein